MSALVCCVELQTNKICFVLLFRYTVVLDFEHFWIHEETESIPVVQLSLTEYKEKMSMNYEFYINKLYIQNCFI